MVIKLEKIILLGLVIFSLLGVGAVGAGMTSGNNMGIIITYGRLAAQALGLGTCWNGWTQIAIHLNPKIKKIAKLRGKAVAAFTIGYPDTEYHRIPPRPMNKVRFIE